MFICIFVKKKNDNNHSKHLFTITINLLFVTYSGLVVTCAPVFLVNPTKQVRGVFKGFSNISD